MTLEHNLYKMRFVTKSKEDQNDTKKASVVKYDIFIPQYLRSLGPG